MNPEHRETLEKILSRPVRDDIPWVDVESMLRRVGVMVKEGSGSRIALVKDREVMVVRRPQSRAHTLGATVRDLASFLGAVGVRL